MYYLSIDIGASSGRHILGHLENGRITLKEIYRFENGFKEENGKRVPIGSFTVPDTGGWMNFKPYPVKLTKPLSGKKKFLLRYDRSGCCNLHGWSY